MATACLCVLTCQTRVLPLNFSLNLNGKFSSQTHGWERNGAYDLCPFPQLMYSEFQLKQVASVCDLLQEIKSLLGRKTNFSSLSALVWHAWPHSSALPQYCWVWSTSILCGVSFIFGGKQWGSIAPPRLQGGNFPFLPSWFNILF